MTKYYYEHPKTKRTAKLPFMRFVWYVIWPQGGIWISSYESNNNDVITWELLDTGIINLIKRKL